ncbi:MAG: isochorismatase family protein [Deltaproteobacteria bacterium]|nr:isochorismatase family protein [Deltaproteobacteria bacterium]
MSYGSDQFTAEKSLFLLMDYQIGAMEMMPGIDWPSVRRNVVTLAKTANALKVPVVVTSCQEDQVQGAMMPELEDAIPDAFNGRIRRTGIINAWDDPRVLAAVRASGRLQVVMAGITFETCLIHPATSAVRQGYEVQAVMDAAGMWSAVAQRVAQRRMERGAVVLTTTHTIIAELAQDWSRAGGADVKALL